MHLPICVPVPSSSRLMLSLFIIAVWATALSIGQSLPDNWYFDSRNELYRMRRTTKIETDHQVHVWLNGRSWRPLQHVTPDQLGEACDLCEHLLQEDNTLQLEFEDERLDESILNVFFDLVDNGQGTVRASDLSRLLYAMDFLGLEQSLFTEFLQDLRDRMKLRNWLKLYLESGEPELMGYLLD